MATNTGQVLTLFVFLWLFVYALVFISFLSSSSSGPSTTVSSSSLSAKEDQLTSNEKSEKEGDSHSHRSNSLYYEVNEYTNPFVSDVCQDSYPVSATSHADRKTRVAVVIPSRNEKKEFLLATVRSVVMNSYGEVLREIIVIDDASDVSISSWKLEWKQIRAEAKNINIYIERSESRLGVSRAKEKGAASASSHLSQVAVFLDSHTIVSKNWLAPLLSTLKENPKAVVYPAIDVIDGDSEIVMKSSNVVGGFDWGFGFRWESVEDGSGTDGKNKKKHKQKEKSNGGKHKNKDKKGDGSNKGTFRIPVAHGATEDQAVFSPASPGIFAIKLDYLKGLGGFDSSLYYWGQESVELSIRTWLCGGVVIRQPCSRVAHRYYHLHSTVPVGMATEGGVKGFVAVPRSRGVSQYQVDRNALTVAEHWLPLELRELTFQSRFAGRVPYPVTLSKDARAPAYLHSATELGPRRGKEEGSGGCQSFQWFLREIYPGLEADIPLVRSAYVSHINRHGTAEDVSYLRDAMGPLLKSYGIYDTAPDHDESGHEGEKKEAKAVKPRQQANDDAAWIADPHERFVEKHKKSLICEDERTEDIPGSNGCFKKALNGQCQDNPTYMMFGCPRSCGFCDANGKICTDRYLRKCPEWVDEGRCGEESVQGDCPVSCRLCIPIGYEAAIAQALLEHEKAEEKGDHEKKNGNQKGIEPENNRVSEVKVGLPDEKAEAALKESGGDKEVVENVVPLQPPHVPADPDAETENNNNTSEKTTGDNYIHDILLPPRIDPYVSQRLWKAGSLPDEPTSDVCKIHGNSNGRLLQKLTLTSPAEMSGIDNVRIFCGTYTMESAHDNNVKVLRNSWGKRCDGWVAFSTKEDLSIPAMSIPHEGDEAYDNMWQKSRAIWRYIGYYYASEFDWFLLGGDDMYYIVENLRYYLGSKDITTKQKEEAEKGKGMFIGRVFQPPNQVVFNSGGAGYLLDKAALKILLDNIDTNPKCFPHQRGFWEDVNVANCLKKSADIVPFDTRDELKRERFHPFTPGQHLDYRPPHVNPQSDWYVKYNPELSFGFDCCSDRSISFHYAKAETMKNLHTYIYLCKRRVNSQ